MDVKAVSRRVLSSVLLLAQGLTAAGAPPEGTTPATITPVAATTVLNAPIRGNDIKPSAESLGKERAFISGMADPEIRISLLPHRSKLIRTKKEVRRTSILNDSVAGLTQLSPTEFEISGERQGETVLTFWFGDPPNTEDVLRYLVVVGPDEAVEEQLAEAYRRVEEKLNEAFPNSQIQLIPVADKVIVRGQARDTEEYEHILSILRGQGATSGDNASGNLGGATPTLASLPDSQGLPSGRLINMLTVPGEQQILLKVRVAELTRTALRELGVDFSIAKDGIALSSILGSGGNITALFDNQDISLFLRATASNGSTRILAEPNLVTLNGQSASFIAGGQFAVPTAVGVGGVQAATTFFQGFGTQLLFTPTLLDKDRVRLQVTPTFSTLNNQNKVNGIPGLNTRSVSTTVDMRAGQWLAIAGLIQDQQVGTSVRVPGLGDIPIVSMMFGHNKVQRDETELLVLVSPELTRPIEADQLPPLLPGMEVTEPGPGAFYLMGMIEGFPDIHHRSTVFPGVNSQAWRALQQQRKANGRFQKCEKFFVDGDHGFSQ